MRCSRAVCLVLLFTGALAVPASADAAVARMAAKMTSVRMSTSADHGSTAGMGLGRRQSGCRPL